MSAYGHNREVSATHSWHPQEADMTPRMPQNIPNWLVDRSFVSIIGNTEPPRDPDDDDDDAEDEEGDDEPDDLDPGYQRTRRIGALQQRAESRIPRARQILGNHMTARLRPRCRRPRRHAPEAAQTANQLVPLTTPHTG